MLDEVGVSQKPKLLFWLTTSHTKKRMRCKDVYTIRVSLHSVVVAAYIRIKRHSRPSHILVWFILDFLSPLLRWCTYGTVAPRVFSAEYWM
jgi:hypothetical protein